MGLVMSLVKVEENSREDLLKALISLGENDLDFIGENGLEYLWEEVWEDNGFEDEEDYKSKGEPKLKYDSNASWLYDYVKDIEDDAECIDIFVRTWMDNDSGYYNEYELNYVRNENNNIVAISLATYSE